MPSIGKDLSALFRNMVGWSESKECTEMFSNARKEVLKNILIKFAEIRADAVINARFTTSQTMASATEHEITS